MNSLIMILLYQLSGAIAILLEDPNHVTEYFINTSDCNILFIYVGFFSSKILVSNIDSAEEDLVKLRQISGELMRLCRGSGRALARIVAVLWENWLGLLKAAKGLEITCEELKQEWKFINEEVSWFSICKFWGVETGL